MVKSIFTFYTGFILSILCSINPATAQDEKQTEKYDPEEARTTVDEFREADPEISKFFDSSFGYAIFPSIGKGAIGVGGAGGKGVVFKQGDPTGGCNMTQVSIGFQFGGQAYSEVIFFEDEKTYDNFINNKFQFAAQASAVALKSGASKDAKYAEGVLVFTMAKGGLMYEASIGGQKFKFVPFEE
jgi:lipid-binding SYLF domain-containing protein